MLSKDGIGMKEGELGFGRKNECWSGLVGMKAGTGRFVKRDQWLDFEASANSSCHPLLVTHRHSRMHAQISLYGWYQLWLDIWLLYQYIYIYTYTYIYIYICILYLSFYFVFVFGKQSLICKLHLNVFSCQLAHRYATFLCSWDVDSLVGHSLPKCALYIFVFGCIWKSSWSP